MPVIRHPSQFESHSESGWVSQAWAGAEVFGEPVPMTVRRHRLEPAAGSAQIPLGGQEAFAYVIAGVGAARAAGAPFTLARESVLVNQLSEQLKARPEELPERISNVVTRLRDAERELAKLRSAQLLEASGQVAGAAENLDGVSFVAHRVPDGTDPDSLRRLALDVRSKFPAAQPAARAARRTAAKANRCHGKRAQATP